MSKTIDKKEFRNWWERVEGDNKHELSAMAAWDQQQQTIDYKDKQILELEKKLQEVKTEKTKYYFESDFLKKEIESCKVTFKDSFINSSSTSIKDIVNELVSRYKKQEAEYAALAIVFSHLPKEEFTVRHEGSYIFVKEWDKFKGYFDKIRTSKTLNEIIKNLANLYKFRRYSSTAVNHYNYIYDENVKELKEKLNEMDTTRVILDYGDEQKAITERAKEYENQPR